MARKPEFLTRHLDAETSYLLKAFFTLGFTLCSLFSKSRAAAVNSTAEVRDSILIGRMHAKDVQRVIGAKFAEYDIPYSFSKYRHWQRGLVKMKGANLFFGS